MSELFRTWRAADPRLGVDGREFRLLEFPTASLLGVQNVEKTAVEIPLSRIEVTAHWGPVQRTIEHTTPTSFEVLRAPEAIQRSFLGVTIRATKYLDDEVEVFVQRDGLPLSLDWKTKSYTSEEKRLLHGKTLSFNFMPTDGVLDGHIRVFVVPKKWLPGEFAALDSNDQYECLQGKLTRFSILFLEVRR